MQVTVQYTTQLRTALNLHQECVEIPEASTVWTLIKQLAQQHPEPFSQFVVKGNYLQPNIIVTVGDQQVIDVVRHVLSQGDVITILSAISGG